MDNKQHIELTGMRIYSGKTVYESALDRIRYIFDEFENVVVAVSGGKDSTVVLQLSLIVARERGRLPLDVMFVDQEIEYEQTIDMMRKIMSDPEVNPIWVQVPFILGNAVSFENPWFNVWGEGEKWIREKEPCALKDNIYGTDRFYPMFDRVTRVHYKGKRIARIGGVRCEESPTRRLALTVSTCYKWVTWGAAHNCKSQDNVLFYPIYDWSYHDVWKAIHSNGWEYNKIYDLQYQHGQPVQKMRVSSLIHDMAVNSLFTLHELSPHYVNKVCERVPGAAVAFSMQRDMYVKDLPPMFKDWKEYRDYLLVNLIKNPEHVKEFRKSFEKMNKTYPDMKDDPDVAQGVYRTEANAVVSGDITGHSMITKRVSDYGRRKREGIL